MKAVILVGGLGTRLRPVTYEIPKPLLPVKKKPIVNHLIELFARHGITDIALLANVGHQEDFSRWKKAWGDDLPVGNISIFWEQKPRGTFGGLQDVEHWVGTSQFILSNGDELKDFDLHALRKFHDETGASATIALVQVPNPQDYGVPVLSGNRIREFLEKPANPPSHYISSGLYVMNPDVFGYADFSKENVMVEKDIFPAVARDGKLAGFKMENGRWYDCGTLARWEKAMEEW